MNQAPLAVLKKLHGSKEKLVDKIVPKLTRPKEESEGAFKKRLLKASSGKLLGLATRVLSNPKKS